MKKVSENVLMVIQKNFHAVIRERASNLIDEHKVDLPDLAPLLTSDDPEAWLDVPGMCGGFSYWLEGEGDQITLISESWSRVVGGSGQRHIITTEGSELVEEGFV